MRLVVGRIVRPHGIRGEVVVHPTTDRPESRFAPGATMRADDGTLLTVAAVRPHAGRLLVRWRGVGDRDAAERLRRLRLTVDVAEDSPTEEDAYYDAQLVGLVVRDAAGTALGTVRAVEHGPAQDLLVVQTNGGTSARVPFVAALVPRVDPEGGWVEVDLPPGLVEDA